MKNYFIATLTVVALLLCGCKDNKSNDPSDPGSTDNGERDYSVRIYVTPEVTEYFNNDIYLTLPGQNEQKLSFGTLMNLDANEDAMALFSISELRVSSDIFKVYGLTFKGTKGKAVIRYDYSVKSDVTLPDTISFGYGYYLGGFMPGTKNYRGGTQDVSYHKNKKKGKVQTILDSTNSLEHSAEIQ